MFIRKDFEEAIKKTFNVKKLAYKGVGQNFYNHCPGFIFDTGKGVICIEVGLYDYYYIFRIANEFVSSDLVYKAQTQINYFYVFNESTHLKINGVTTSFSGTAFDFTKELVLLALEGEN